MGYTPHVLVIGGGVLGTGIARDLAIRGLDVSLVEDGPLGIRAARRGLGIVHSGIHSAHSRDIARLVSEENQTLRQIASSSIGRTNGLLVSQSRGPLEELQKAADAISTSTESVDSDELAEREPAVAESFEFGITVPDAVVDTYELALATAESAREYGTSIKTHTEVVDIAVDGGTIDTVTLKHDPSPQKNWEPPVTLPDGGRPGAPGGGESHSSRTMPGEGSGDHKLLDEPSTEEIDPDYVVNAAAGRIKMVAARAGIDIELPTVAELTVRIQECPTETVVTRCSTAETAPSVAPGRGCGVVGTVGETISEDRTPAVDQVATLKRQAAELVPVIENTPIRQAHTCLRVRSPRSESKHDHSILDHGDGDGCWGMTSVTGGSLSTHRYVAERVVDDICSKFGIRRSCKTAEIPLPSVDSVEVSAESAQRSPVVCDSQSVREADIEAAVRECGPPDIRELRLRTGMESGVCDGGRCAYRIGSVLYPEYDESVVSEAVHAYLDSYWETQRPLLGSDSLERVMRTYRSYIETMGLDAENLTITETAPDEASAEGDATDGVELTAFADGEKKSRAVPPTACERTTGGEFVR